MVVAERCDGRRPDDDLDRAVRAARGAFEDGRWRDRPAKANKALMHRLADLLDRHAEELALLECLGELARSAAIVSPQDHARHLADA